MKLNPSSQSTSVHRPASALEPISVAIVIASRLERLGWSIVVDNQEDMAVAGQFSSFDSALTFLADHFVDVALADEIVLTPGVCEAIGKLSRRHRPRILILARDSAENPFAQPSHPMAARLLLKGLPAGELLAAIREAVGAGRTSASEAGQASASS